MPSTALAKYAYKRAVLSGYRPVKRMRMSGSAYSRAGYAARIGYYGAKWAAPRIQRWYRRRRRSKVGRRTLPSQKTASKAHAGGVPGGANQQMALGELNYAVLPYPPLGTGSVNEVNVRKNNSVYFKGVRICRTFYLPTTATHISTTTGIEIHWCLMQQTAASVSNIGAFDGNIKSNFWRDHTAATSKGRNWVDYAPTDVWSAEYNCLKPMQGNDFKVLTHRKKTLWRPFSDNTKPYFWKIDKYFKINKQIDYMSSTSGVPQLPIYEVFWCNTISSDGFPADPTVNTVNFWQQHTMYFRDSMN